MRFNKVMISNFLSYGEEQEVDLDRQGLVGIFGSNADSAFDSNGSGKSTILEAIVWCLWGETVRGLKGDEVINSKVGENCEVVLHMEEGGRDYRAVRYRNKNGTKKKNDLILTVDGTDATAGVVAETQLALNDIIGIDFHTFSQSVLLTGQIEPFCTLPDSRQKEVLEDILNIDLLRKAQANIKQKMQGLELELSTIISAQEVMEDNKESLNHSIKSLEQKSKGFEKEKEYKKTKITGDLVSSKRHLVEILKAEEELKEIDQKLSNSHGDLEGKNGEFEVIEHSIEQICEKVEVSKDVVNRKQIEAETKLALRRRSIEGMSSMAGQMCVTCNQVVDPDYVEDHIAMCDQDIEGLRKNLNKLDDILNRLEEAKEVDLAPLLEERGRVKALMKDIKDREKDLLVSRASLSVEVAKKSMCEANIRSIQERIDEESAAENPYDELMEEEKKKLKSTKESISNGKKRGARAEIDLKAHRFWDIGFGNKGLKSYIMDNVVPFLNERAQRYADIMSDGSLQIRFSTQTRNKSGGLREKFNVEVTNASGADVYKGNSSGERRRADVAVGWALADLAATRAQKPIRFRGLDEPFENLDSEGIDAVFKLLQNATSEYETIFVITHNTDLKPRFTKEIVVTKKAGSSRISQ